MAKKNLASLMNGFMGSPDNEEITDNIQAISDSDLEEMKSNQESRRKKNVGRPRKGLDSQKSSEIRATFIVDPSFLQKIKYISLIDGCLLKDVVSEAFSSYITDWESENGVIRLPKSKKL